MIQDFDIFTQLSKYLDLGEAENFTSVQINQYAEKIIEKNEVDALQNFDLQLDTNQGQLGNYIDIGKKVLSNK